MACYQNNLSQYQVREMACYLNYLTQYQVRDGLLTRTTWSSTR